MLPDAVLVVLVVVPVALFPDISPPWLLLLLLPPSVSSSCVSCVGIVPVLCKHEALLVDSRTITVTRSIDRTTLLMNLRCSCIFSKYGLLGFPLSLICFSFLFLDSLL